eukprot:CAMPEP_0185852774 /NCGR_PEP_ID=MMETSP1354-20130828/16231_1 /TAXON_ID=708628 /ORGANISM="Erythrolobus madagascarensis, Strain CCMP3276" /LENGTH=126 /DNA_ID=CAMNT_0028554119 /DNA_START=111 /DNA_END=491 /DNA_ORIENTATION=-
MTPAPCSCSSDSSIADASAGLRDQESDATCAPTGLARAQPQETSAARLLPESIVSVALPLKQNQMTSPSNVQRRPLARFDQASGVLPPHCIAGRRERAFAPATWVHARRTHLSAASTAALRSGFFR